MNIEQIELLVNKNKPKYYGNNLSHSCESSWEVFYQDCLPEEIIEDFNEDDKFLVDENIIPTKVLDFIDGEDNEYALAFVDDEYNIFYICYSVD